MLHYLEQAAITTSTTSPGANWETRLAKVSRRGFLAGGAAALSIAAFAGPAEAFKRYPVGGEQMPHGLRDNPLVFVTLYPDGSVEIVAHRSEMGQGARTSLPMVVADEMGADWSRVTLIQAEGNEPKYGNQDTDGSRSMRHHLQSMRQIGASVRLMLARAAAEQWGVEIDKVEVGVHEVSSGANLAGFGELAAAAMLQPVPAFEELSFKEESEFRYIGKGNVEIYDLHDITTGKAIYGADVRLPGMKFAVIARPPVVGGKVRSFDARRALELPGVEQVMELPGSIPPAKFAPLGGVAVIASNTDAAIKGRDALEIEWDDGPHGGYNSAAFLAEMRETAKKPGEILRDEGDVDAAFGSAARSFAREYSQAHMVHAAMEPLVSVANVTNSGAELWAPVQSPSAARQDVATALGMDMSDVRMNVTLLGGGFGRKSKCDDVIEAALISQAIGSPVKVQWTREDDIRHSFNHTTSVERIEVALDASDKIVAWRHNSVAPSILSTFAPDSGHQFFIESGMGHVDMPFEIPNVRCENGKAMAHTRIGWFRAVSNIPRAWAIQSFAAELADELGKDQREMLLELIGADRQLDPEAQGFPDDYWNYGETYSAYPIDTKRLKGVLNLAADKAGWGAEMLAGEGWGLAVHRSFVTYVASAVRVKIEEGRITVPEVHMAVDCGFAVNPERIRSQMEGSAVMGMTLALHSGVTYENGAVVQSNFNDYPMVRSTNFPKKVHTHIVEHPFSVHASGVGEPGLPPIAPALANAVFNATGKRLRDLPMGDTVET
ncbi:xanthine dehydrogenase family protein molybdopterin-binding subunit [Algihabitans albus]|uniref:xanthine dehydrogenase family protein molybdopterin-binding subunit n=1 Tax=Algihabitans albus TaxID=2164067 RepID=UPI000E5C5D83|nr:molybdopterin cofactor-binding domain-containing protein [Algihabitans albus]